MMRFLLLFIFFTIGCNTKLPGTVYYFADALNTSGDLDRTYYLSEDKLRLDFKMQSKRISLFYKYGKDLVVIANHSDKTLMKTKGILALLKKAPEARKFKKQLPKEVLDAYKKQFSQYFGNMGSMSEQMKVEWRETGSKKLILAYNCQMYEGHSNGKKRFEVCIAKNEEVGLQGQSLKVWETISKLVAELARNYWVGNKGFPLRTQYFDDSGNRTMEQKLIKIETNGINQDLFKMPLDYRLMNGSN